MCGSYADAKAKGLARPCKGAPDHRVLGGMAGQLRKLRRNKHPRTGEQLPTTVDVNGCEWTPGPLLASSGGTYSNLPHYRDMKREAEAAAAFAATAWGSFQAAVAAALPVPDVPPVVSQSTRRAIDASPPRSARQKMHERLLRVREKEAQAKMRAMLTVEPMTGASVQPDNRMVIPSLPVPQDNRVVIRQRQRKLAAVFRRQSVSGWCDADAPPSKLLVGSAVVL